jgi:hypothetical protein
MSDWGNMRAAVVLAIGLRRDLPARYRIEACCTSRGEIKVAAASSMRCAGASRLSLVGRCRLSRLFRYANCNPPVPRLKRAGPSCSAAGSPAQRSNSSLQ